MCVDVPHLIKLVKNHFLDDGFIIIRKEISYNIIEKIISLDAINHLNIAHKITMETLLVKSYPG